MSTGAPQEPVNFKIVRQEHEWIYNATGPRTGQWVVTFETPSGTQSQVTIGDSAYTAGNVATLIALAVKAIEEVNQLTSGVPPTSSTGK